MNNNEELREDEDIIINKKRKEDENNKSLDSSLTLESNKDESKNSYSRSSLMEELYDNNDQEKKMDRRGSVFLNEKQEAVMAFLKSNKDKYKNRKLNINYKKSLGIKAEAINLDKVDEEKRNILHRACLQIKLSIIEDIEADLTPEYVNKVDKYGNSPLILACKLPSKFHFSERNKIIGILIKHGADIQCIEPINGWTALHWCCFNGDLASAKTLIINGANFFLPSKSGHFPIDLAGEKSKGDLVKYLINITIKYLEKIKDYELLQIETNHNNNNVMKQKNSDVLFDNINRSINTFSSLSKEIYSKKESNNSGKKDNNIHIDLSKLSKIEQTVYLRLFTEHCLYWASYYNYNGEIIDRFLNNFHAHAAFPIFCLENRTAMHAACIQGSQIPFRNLLKNYEEKKEMREKLYGKSKKNYPINIESSSIIKVHNIEYPIEYNIHKKRFESSSHFNTLNRKYKNHIISHFFELIFPRSYVENLEFEDIVDKEGNSPIVLAAKNNQYNFFYFLQDKELIKNMDKLFNLENKVGYSGYYYIKDISFKNNLIKSNSKKIYPIPYVVLDLNRNDSTKTSINLIMKIGVSEKLEIELMQHIDKSRLYILININEQYFYQQAEKEKIHIKLLRKNLKLPFENNQKYISIVEPFLSRHYQYIIMKTISNLLDIQMLKDQKILNDIFLTHNPNVTNKIFNKIIKQKIYWPNPLCFIHDYISEGKNIKNSHIQLLYRYFGQAISMFYAFYGFFTVMYCPLAIISLIYTIIYLKSLFISNDMYPTFFIIFAVWNLLAMAKWKRKSEEIQHKWGMKISPDQQKMRTEFKGDEYYSDLDAPLEKYIDIKTSIISFFVGLPFILLFLGLIIASSHYVTIWENSVQNENNFFNKYFPSLIRALSIIIIFYVYDYVSLYITNLGNIKYEDKYEYALILSIFIFRTSIDFISIFYNVFFTKNIYRLKILLYTNIIMRFIAEIIVRILYPIISNHLSRRKYFKSIAKKSKYHFINNPKKNDDNKNTEILSLRQSENEILTKDKKDLNLYVNDKTIGEKYNRISMITGSSLSYEKSNDLSNINPDFIEIQSSLKQKRALFYDYADIFMIHCLISQCIIIIPFGPLICFIFSIFSQNAKLYLDIFYLKRSPPLSCRGIRIWNRLLEFNSIIMTVTNCFLYYYFGNNNYITSQVANNTEISIPPNDIALIIIVCSEHIIIIIQYLLKYSIPEVPKWVKKERENLIGFYGLLNNDKERKQSLELTMGLEKLRERIENLNKDIKDQKDQLRQYENSIGDYRRKLLEKDGKIKEYADVLNILFNSRRRNLYEDEKMNFPRLRSLVMDKNKKIENIILNDKKQGIEPGESLDLFLGRKKVQNFIDIKFDFILQKLVSEISPPNSSNIFNEDVYITPTQAQNIRKTYCFYKMKKTLDYIENIILSKRLEFLLNNTNSPITICSTCSNKVAEFQCEECQELFCPKCKKIHVSNELWENHQISYFKLPFKKIINNETTPVSFIKGESFSFPVSMSNNLGYSNLMHIFNVLFVKYISDNGINNENMINFKEDIFNKVDFFIKLDTVPSKIIEEQVEFLFNDENSSFNLTEIFFINRICFKNFKFFGATTTIDKIYIPLKYLQISTLEKKIIILLNILDIYDNKLILRSEFKKFFSFTNYQYFSDEFSLENIINTIYKDNRDSIEFSEAFNNIIYNPFLVSIFKYLLQCNEDENNNE